MAAIFRRPKGSPTPLRKLGRTSLLLLALALCAGSVAPAAPARAAPAAQETITNMRFYLNVDQPDKYCAGEHYSIRVIPLVELSGVAADRRRFTQSDRVVTGVPVKAEIQDTNIATIQPPTQQTGAVDIHRNWSMPAQQALGAVTFQLHARTAGTTNLYLTAQVPARYAGGRISYFGPNAMPAGFPIQVLNCEYLVSVIYDWQMSGTGYRYWSVGTMNTRIKASDPEFYGGDGTLAFFLNHYDVTCSERLTFDNPTHITAHRNLTTDQLELIFTMTEGAATPRCPNTYLVSNSPFTDKTSPWGGQALSFPASGGTQRIQLVANVPGTPPTGWATISVQPVVAGGR